MRVLFLTHRLPYAPNRGDRIRSYHMLRTLAQAGVEVDLLSLVHDRAEESHAPDLRGLVASVATARVPRLRNLIRGLATLPTPRPLTHVLLDAPAMRSSIERLVRDRPPDVVLAYCSGMARFALEAPLDRFPLLLDLVDVDSAKWASLAGATRAPKRWIYSREARRLGGFEARAARFAHVTTVVNERERATLARLAPEANACILENGIDLASFRPEGPPTAEPRIVFCGVMSYPPNEAAALWFAREVWPSVRAALPGARFTIVGADPPRALEAAAAADPTIEVTGTVPDVRSFLWRAAVSVAPLATARGVQNKVLEALAAGLPCVVKPAVAEGLPADALPGCIVADGANEFAAAVLDLAARPPAARRSFAGAASLARLGWPERLARLVPLLEEAAGRLPQAAPVVPAQSGAP